MIEEQKTLESSPSKTLLQGPSSGTKLPTAATPKSSHPATSTAAIKLPICAPGELSTRNQTPCQPRRGQKGGGNHSHHKKHGFRIPLKKEDGNLQNQIVEYNCEFPNRVVVRLEYLMQTTKVRLNDKQYMDDFYNKLIDEENRAMMRTARMRERGEVNRMKRLIINQVEKDIPKELEYLIDHPVFKVNEMLERLVTFDTALALNPRETMEEMTPVEPYEYNGNTFFMELHNTGEIWMPEEVKKFEEEKRERKLHRAKLRLIKKRKEQAAEEKVMRILSEAKELGLDMPQGGRRSERRPERRRLDEEEEEDYDYEEVVPQKEEEKAPVRKPSWYLEIEAEAKNGGTDEDKELYEALHLQTRSKPYSVVDLAVEKIQSSLQKQAQKIQRKIERSKAAQMEEEKKLDKLRRAQEKYYVDTYDYDKARINRKYKAKLRKGQVCHIFDGDDDKKKSQVNLNSKSRDNLNTKSRENLNSKSRENLNSKSRDNLNSKSGDNLSSKEGEKRKTTAKSDKVELRPSEPSSKRSVTRRRRSCEEIQNEAELFAKLQKHYGLKKYPYHHFAKYKDAKIMSKLDKANEWKEVYDRGNEVANMYTRELVTVLDKEEGRVAKWAERFRQRKTALEMAGTPSSAKETMSPPVKRIYKSPKKGRSDDDSDLTEE